MQDQPLEQSLAGAVIRRNSLQNLASEFQQSLGSDIPQRNAITRAIPYLLADWAKAEKKPFDAGKVKTLQGDDLLHVILTPEKTEKAKAYLAKTYRDSGLNEGDAVEAAEKLFNRSYAWVQEDDNFERLKSACKEQEKLRCR